MMTRWTKCLSCERCHFSPRLVCARPVTSFALKFVELEHTSVFERPVLLAHSDLHVFLVDKPRFVPLYANADATSVDDNQQAPIFFASKYPDTLRIIGSRSTSIRESRTRFGSYRKSSSRIFSSTAQHCVRCVVLPWPVSAHRAQTIELKVRGGRDCPPLQRSSLIS